MGGSSAVRCAPAGAQITLFAAVLSWGFSAPARGEADGTVLHTDRQTGRATVVLPGSGGKAQSAARTPPAPSKPLDILKQHGKLFGVRDPDLQLLAGKTIRDRLGFSRTRFHQVHRGVPVFGGEIRVHQDKAGGFRAANGKFMPVPDKLDTNPRLNLADAVTVALNALGRGEPAVEKAELVVVDPGWYGDRPMGAKLAWHVVLRDSSAVIREAFFIDAENGAVLDRWDMIHRARNRRIYDGAGGWELPGQLVRTEGDPARPDLLDVDRAYDYAGDTYDFYWRAFGRDSIDDAGMPIIVTVNSAALDCPNAYWDGQQMLFCAGLVTDDVMAHELTHGVTEHTADLIYQNQPGQLNESFSDVFAELIDLFNGNVGWSGPPASPPEWPTHPTGPGTDVPNNLRTGCSYPMSYGDGVRWMIGEDVYDGAIRDMWDPTCFGDPDRAYSVYQTCSPFDYGGVHSGSGIPNHAFALVVDGGTFNGYTISGIGPIKAGAIWYRALTTYLAVASDFSDAYFAFLLAAEDFKTSGVQPNDPRTGLPSGLTITDWDIEQLDKALQATEMNTDGACGATVPILNPIRPVRCPQEKVIFFDDFENGPNGWTTVNTQPPTTYDWELLSHNVPYGRSGTVWWCQDPDIGDCRTIDEGGSHYLISPPLTLPAGWSHPKISFEHYVATEPGWDGGNLSISVNGGAWQDIYTSHIEYNTYNSYLSMSGSNPLRGRPAWSGAGGGWGVSVVNLSTYVSPGQTFRIRFNFGKDGCDGVRGWYVDNFMAYECSPYYQADVDADGDVDGQDFGWFAGCFNGAGSPVKAGCEAADLNHDGAVDGIDFGYFAACYNGNGNAPSAQCSRAPDPHAPS